MILPQKGFSNPSPPKIVLWRLFIPLTLLLFCISAFAGEIDCEILNNDVAFYPASYKLPTVLATLLIKIGIGATGEGSRISFGDSISQVTLKNIIDTAENAIGYSNFMGNLSRIPESFREIGEIGGFIILTLLVILVGCVFFMKKRTKKFIILHQQFLEESDRTYKYLFNSVADSILIYDWDGKIIDFNDNACQIYGYSRLELKAIEYVNIVHPECHSILNENRQRIRVGETILIETVHIRKDGTSFPVELKLLGVKIGDKSAIISVIRDISDRKKQEEAIKKHSDWMEALLRAPSEGFWIVDSAKRIVLVNDAYI